MKLYLLLTIQLITFSICAQTIDKVVGTYQKIDSNDIKYLQGNTWIKDIDTTQLILNKDMTFIYHWSPMFGPYSKKHIETTGTWSIVKGEVFLHSKYQKDEYRVIEEYKPLYADTVKIYVQTYDSLIGFFQFSFIGVESDTFMDQMIFKDYKYPYNACSAVFKTKGVKKIYCYGEFGKMPVVKPEKPNSNHFLIQYNLSTNWDYQYFKDYQIYFDNEEVYFKKKNKGENGLKKVK